MPLNNPLRKITLDPNQLPPAAQLMFGGGNPSLPGQLQAQPAAPAMAAAGAPPASRDISSFSLPANPYKPDVEAQSTALIFPKPPDPYVAKPVMSQADYYATPEGKAYSDANPAYRPAGKMQQFLAALGAGMQEFGGEMRGRPGIGYEAARDFNSRQYQEEATNRARPGMLAKQYQEAYLGPQREQQQMGIQAHNEARQDYGVQMQQMQIQRELQAKVGGYLRDAISAKEAGKIPDEQIIHNMLTEATAQGIPLKEAQLRRVVAATKSTGAAFEGHQDPKGRFDYATDRSGKRYLESDIVDAKGNPMPGVDPELVKTYYGISNSHLQSIAEERATEKIKADIAGRYQENAARLSRANIVFQQGAFGNASDPRMQPAVDLVASGKVDLTTVLWRMPPNAKANFLSMLAQQHPDFDQKLYGVEKTMAIDATSGHIGKTLNAFNTATEHLKLLGQLSDGLGNGDMQMINNAANKFQAATGSTAPTNFEMAKNAVAGEIAKTFKGTATEGEISKINSTISQAMSPGQLKAVIGTATSLMEFKKHALQQQYESGMQGRPAFDVESARAAAGGHVIRVGNKNYQYKGSGDTSSMKNYTEVK